MSEIGMVTGTNSGQSPYAWYNLMNQGAGNFMQQGGVANNNWFTSLQNRWNNSNFGAGMNSMGQAMGGWGNAMGGLNALMSMYTGWKSLGLQDRSLRMQRNQFNANYDAQRKAYENDLRERWLARDVVAQDKGYQFESEESWLASRALPENSARGRRRAKAG